MKRIHKSFAACLLATLVLTSLQGQTKGPAPTAVQGKAAAVAATVVPVTNELRGVPAGRYPLKDSSGAPRGAALRAPGSGATTQQGFQK